MRILIINCDYQRFLARMYAEQPDLAGASYDEQMAARNATLFGVADFYSSGFRSHGQEAYELHVNNAWMQAAWAREHGMHVIVPPAPSRSEKRRLNLSTLATQFLPRALHRYLRRRLHGQQADILRAQIEHYKPDVILNQEMGYVRSPFLKSVRSRRIRIVGQIAAALPVGERFDVYDLVVSSLPNQVEWFRARGVRAELNRLAFEPSVLSRVGEIPATRDVPVSFVGSLSIDHASRIKLLEHLARRVDLQIWGPDVGHLPKSSPLHACYRGEAWGREMYQILLRSRITINHHGDLAEGNANNMRLYEATGCGALMFTEAARNLHEILAPGREVIAYTDDENCAREVERLLRDDTERARIAEAGQRRTLSEHTYQHRTAELLRKFESLCDA